MAGSNATTCRNNECIGVLEPEIGAQQSICRTLHHIRKFSLNFLFTAGNFLVCRSSPPGGYAVTPSGYSSIPYLEFLICTYAQIFMAEPDNQGGYAVTPHPLPWASPGRSLGAKFDANGDLLIANAPLGLLQLASPGDAQSQRLLLLTGRVSDESPLSSGYPIEFANSLDVAADGTVYFTSSTDVVPYR